jgi:small redox-active disulfide protein 2
MNFKIYGSGCAKCKLLAAHTETAAQALGITYDLEKVADVNEIIAAGIMRTPALAIDDEIAIEGKVPSADAIKKLLA